MKLKTKLGQNFLTDKSVVGKMMEVSDIKSDEVVLEIGPGKGILTEALAKKAGKVITVEVDKKLVNHLKNKFRNQKNVEIIYGDILKKDLRFMIQSACRQSRNLQYKVVANLPYYITSKILRLFLELENHPREMILMVQKEVAERIVANKGEMSILAVSVQYYAEPEILFDVSRESFNPIPEVDSSVIRVSRIAYRESSESKKFFRIVKAGFCARRKTLANNLSNSFHLDKKEIGEKIKTAGINPTVRAQELSVEDWEKLAEIF